MSRSTHIVEIAPVEEVVRPVPRVVDSPPASIVRLERKSDRWSLVILLTLSCLFAVVFGKFVLSPAVDSLAGNPTSSWIADGP